jgi:Holliday junction DNA helicase RuvA
VIAHLRGVVAAKGRTSAVVDVGGIGLAVELTTRHLGSLDIGAEVSTPTTTLIRPESMTLYGFMTEDEAELFDLLRSTTGIGPRSAMATLGALTVESIAGAVQRDDDTPFRTVPGIGPKTARLLVMSLRGKVDRHAPDSDGAPANEVAAHTASLKRVPARPEALAALTSLGWSRRKADEALDAVIDREGRDAALPLPALIRGALAELGPARR